jgi:uncharacterized circularly permuted ATP-grasp superfamily protein
VIAASEWTRLERGIVQRVKAMETFLADIYGDQQIVRDGVLPKRLITSCAHFHRQAARLVPPNGVRVHVSGSTWSGTRTVCSVSLRTTCAVRPGCPT